MGLGGEVYLTRELDEEVLLDLAIEAGVDDFVVEGVSHHCDVLGHGNYFVGTLGVEH